MLPQYRSNSAADAESQACIPGGPAEGLAAMRKRGGGAGTLIAHPHVHFYRLYPLLNGRGVTSKLDHGGVQDCGFLISVSGWGQCRGEGTSARHAGRHMSRPDSCHRGGPFRGNSNEVAPAALAHMERYDSMMSHSKFKNILINKLLSFIPQPSPALPPPFLSESCIGSPPATTRGTRQPHYTNRPTRRHPPLGAQNAEPSVERNG